MKNFVKVTMILWVLMALIATAVPYASADTTGYTLTDFNISGFSGPFGEVTVNRTSSTTATITFTSDVVGGNIYLFGDGGSVAVNVNATSFTLGTITGSNSGTGFSPGPYSDGGAGNEDGFGSFNQTINSFDGFTSSSDTISFTLTNTSGTWASASQVLTANSDGHSVAAHIFITSSPANAQNTAIVTGFATDGGTATPSGTPRVPEPSTLILLGAGLLALRMVSKKVGKRSV